MTEMIAAIMSHASIRRFSEQDVPDELIEKIARAGQQAPFTGQMYACIYTKDQAKRERLAKLFGPLITRAPLFMLFCLDYRKLEKFIASKGRQNTASDAMMLFLGIQDVAYFGQNMVLAAESLGLGTCFLGSAPNLDTELRQLFQLPDRVYPVVGMVLGYAAESPSPRPRIPTQYVLHKESYRDLTPEDVDDALGVMDAGLIREGYYSSRNSKIPQPEAGEDPVGFDKYGWGEHISRKYARRGRTTDNVMDDLRRAKIEP